MINLFLEKEIGQILLEEFGLHDGFQITYIEHKSSCSPLLTKYHMCKLNGVLLFWVKTVMQ